LQHEISEWADQVVPGRTTYSIIAKLLEEIGELIASERMNDPAELADVAILVMDLFYLQRISIADAVKTKMQTNRSRCWTVSDSGAARHV